jgi:ABC-2 type transport system permease protein
MNARTSRTAGTDGAAVDVDAFSGLPGQGSTQTQVLHTYRRPQWVLALFVVRRTARSAVLWGAVMGLYVYASTVGFTDLAPTPAGRQPFLAALAGNTGLKAMFGVPYRIDTVGGFVTWRAAGVMSLVGALWGLLVATRVTRGEEAAGRWEPFLAGRTTHRRAAAQALAGLGCALLLMLAIAAAATIAVGTRPDVGFGVGPSLLFALSITAGAAEFIVVGTLAAQIMPIRARAASLAAGVFGVAFLLRAIADIAPQAHWLVYVSPLGWIEQVRALSDPQPIWLLPIGAFVAAAAAGTIWLAGRRDLGASTWADKVAKESHTGLLSSQRLLAIRLSRTSAISWVAIAGLGSLLYGTFATSAGDAFASSDFANKLTGGITHQGQQATGVRLYAGIIFLFMMLALMGYVASAAGAIREQEAEGYLDNLLVRQVGRAGWLATRAEIVLAVTLLAGLTAGVGFWLGSRGGAGISLGELAAAGLNATAPAILLLGFAILVIGLAPRWTSTLCYALIAWSFLLDMLGPVMHPNHWVLDTSLLQHPALAPTTAPNWQVVATYTVLGMLLAVAGTARFVRRDLQPT